jgi:hypothetical protein
MGCSQSPTISISSPNFGIPASVAGRGTQQIRAVVLHAVPYGRAGVDFAATQNKTTTLVQGSKDSFHYYVEGTDVVQYVQEADIAWTFQRYGVGVVPAPVPFPVGSTFPLTTVYPADPVDKYTLNIGVSTGALGVMSFDRCGTMSCRLPEQTREALEGILCCVLERTGLTVNDIFLSGDVDPASNDFPSCFNLADIRLGVAACLAVGPVPVGACAAPAYNSLLSFSLLGCQNGQMVAIPANTSGSDSDDQVISAANASIVVNALPPVGIDGQINYTLSANPSFILAQLIKCDATAFNPATDRVVTPSDLPTVVGSVASGTIVGAGNVSVEVSSVGSCAKTFTLKAQYTPGAGSNSLSSALNTMTSVVSGISSNAPIINSNALSLSGTDLTSTINGTVSSAALDLTPAVNAAELANSSANGAITTTGTKGRTLTLVVDPASTGLISVSAAGLKVDASPAGATTNVLSSAGAVLTSTVNGVTDTENLTGAVNTAELPNVAGNGVAVSGTKNRTISVLPDPASPTVVSVSASGVSVEAPTLAQLTAVTTNVLNSVTNTLNSTVNGISDSTPIINTNDLSSAGTILTSTVNGVSDDEDLTGVVNAAELANSSANGAITTTGTKGRTLTLVVDPASTASISVSAAGLRVDASAAGATTNVLSSTGAVLTSTVNGVADTEDLTGAVNTAELPNVAGNGVAVSGTKDRTISVLPDPASLLTVVSTASGVAVNPTAGEITALTTNDLSVTGAALTSTVNGVSDVQDLTGAVNTAEIANTGADAISATGTKGRAIALVIDPASPILATQGVAGLSIPLPTPSVTPSCSGAPETIALTPSGWKTVESKRELTTLVGGGTFAPDALGHLVVCTGATGTIDPPATCDYAWITLKNFTSPQVTVVLTGHFDGVANATLTLSTGNAFGTAAGEAVDIEWNAALATYIVH